jgi:predicted Zn-dependent protease
LFAPRDAALIEQLMAVHARSGNVAQTRAWSKRLVAARPDDVALRMRVLDALEQVGDRIGARPAAAALEARAGDEVAAWQRLSAYYSRVGDTGALERVEREVQRLGR